MLPGMLDVLEPDDPGMHTTDTIDFEVILSGECVLELDDGEERVLRAGRHRDPERHPAPLAKRDLGAVRDGRVHGRRPALRRVAADCGIDKAAGSRPHAQGART